MSRRKRDAISPTLFPFLAVLVCTLGTLILFLALVAQEAKSTARQRQQAQVEPVPDPTVLTAKAAKELIAVELFRANHLVSLRDEQTNEIERRRDELTYLDEQTNKLKTKLNQLRDEVAEATRRQTPDEVDEETLVLLREQISAEEAAIIELEKTVAGQKPRVVIVPHEGPNGTDRRAVYLECTSKGVTVWPEGVLITPVQLADTTSTANPLDAALRTIRHHAMQHFGDEVAPYPLLVVRPDGPMTYVMARKAMRDWDDQFGYELVPADVDLSFPGSDAELKKRVEVAVRQAALRQPNRFAVGSGGRGGFGPGGTSDVSRDLRGATSVGQLPGDRASTGSQRRRRLPTLSAAELDRQGRMRGYQQPNHITRDAQTGQAFYDPRSDLDRMIDNIPSRANNLNRERDADAIRASESDVATTGDRSRSEAPHSPSRIINNTFADPANFGLPSESASSPDQPPRDPPSLSFRPNEPSPSEGEITTSSAQQHAAANSSRPNEQRSQGSAGATPSRPSMQLTPPQNDPNVPQRQPPPSSMARPSTPSKPDVRRQGRDWALPSQMAQMRGTEVVRTIRMECHHDRFVLIDARDPSRSETFLFENGDIQRATLKLATSLRDRVETWGTSLPGGRWQPRLGVDVMP
ncbi:MAG: hypothetical protein AAF989_01485, partial [Planctomycetota bacterium]